MNETTTVTPVQADLPVLDQECCDPDCGPDTCAPQAAPLETEKPAQVQAQCCDPDCGPGTCG